MYFIKFFYEKVCSVSFGASDVSFTSMRIFSKWLQRAFDTSLGNYITYLKLIMEANEQIYYQLEIINGTSYISQATKFEFLEHSRLY